MPYNRHNRIIPVIIMKKFSGLFQRGRIGKMAIKNRLIMPSMVLDYADGKGFVTKRYVDHIERVARGGVGAIILEASFISPEGRGFLNELGIHSDRTIDGLKKLVAAAHKHGSKIGIQLYHAGRQTSSKVTGTPPVAPSALPDPTVNELPRALDETEILRLVRAYGKAASRAKKAGCDFVEIHGAHGYLITQFLSAYSNKRKDRYGGTLSKRMTFLLEVFAEVRKTVGKDFPVTVRLSGDEMVPGGLTIRDTVAIAKKLEEVGADALHISAGNYASYTRGYMISPMAMKDGPLVHLAAEVKKHVGIPVIAVGKIRTPELATAVLKKKQADFIGLGRTLLADPDWPEKVRSGKIEEINRCIACNQGCIGRLFEQKDVWCTVNPETGRENMFVKTKRKKKQVAVVGGGPGGLEAARVAALLGHAVTLYEQNTRLGGQLFAAAASPHRPGWEELRKHLEAEMKRLKVNVRLKTQFTAQTLEGIKADAIILATGSYAKLPSIPGIEDVNVLVSRDLLEGKVKAKGRVVVAGGGCAGAQTAEYLAVRGHKVTLVSLTEQIAADAPSDDRSLLLGRLKKLGVKVLSETTVMAIEQKHVVVENYQGVSRIPVDTVVICLGSFSNDFLEEEVRAKVSKVVKIGDAVEPRKVTEAMMEGAMAALTL